MKVTTSIISFRIDIDFEGCDVDAVYDEYRARGVQTPAPTILTNTKRHKVKGNKTPIKDTVDFALHWLAGYADRQEMCTQSNRYFSIKTGKDHVTELEKLGVSVESWNSLMMGNCHLICEVDYKKFSTQLVSNCQLIVYNIFKEFVKYYNN